MADRRTDDKTKDDERPALDAKAVASAVLEFARLGRLTDETYDRLKAGVEPEPEPDNDDEHQAHDGGSPEDDESRRAQSSKTANARKATGR